MWWLSYNFGGKYQLYLDDVENSAFCWVGRDYFQAWQSITYVICNKGFDDIFGTFNYLHIYETKIYVQKYRLLSDSMSSLQ